MTGEDNKWKQQYDDALDFVEENDALSADNIKQMMSDEETCTLVGDLLDCRQAMQKEYSHRAPNTNDEWRKFADKHLSQETALPSQEKAQPDAQYHNETQEPKKQHHYRPMIIGAITGIAATLLCVLAFSWMRQIEESRLPEGYLVYEAKDAPQPITLMDGDDEVTDFEYLEQDKNAKDPQSGTATRHTLDYTQHSTLHAPHSIQLLTVPTGKDIEVILADGTKVFLNADSRLEYPSTFEGTQRTVKLHGEAYFDVKKDSSRPFVVETERTQTTVHGTKFNITSYDSQPTKITLIEGKVAVKDLRSGRVEQLVPGDNVSVAEGGEMTKTAVDIDGYVYWQEGFFYFDNQPLSEIMQSLGRWYNVSVVFANRKAMDYRFHFLCDRNGDIDHAITLLNRMKKLSVTRQGNTIVVK